MYTHTYINTYIHIYSTEECGDASDVDKRIILKHICISYRYSAQTSTCVFEHIFMYIHIIYMCTVHNSRRRHGVCERVPTS